MELLTLNKLCQKKKKRQNSACDMYVVMNGRDTFLLQLAWQVGFVHDLPQQIVRNPLGPARCLSVFF